MIYYRKGESLKIRDGLTIHNDAHSFQLILAWTFRDGSRVGYFARYRKKFGDVLFRRHTATA